ncbi:ATP-binding protein [Serratia marcescens]|uniref:ATP-binding protein n=1 Tax=Serratia marcescens TaxID=615 RepID=UPI003204BC95
MDEQSASPFQANAHVNEQEQVSHFLAAVALVDVALQAFYQTHQVGGGPAFIVPAYLQEDEPGNAPLWSTQVANWQHAVPEFSLKQHSRLAQLVERYQLTNFELAVILVGCLNRLEPRYQQLFSALPFQRNGRPSLELMLRVFCEGTYARQAYEQSFSPDAPLLRHGLIALQPDKAAGCTLFETPEWVHHWLLGEYRMPTALESVSRWLMPQPDGASSEVDALLDMASFPPLLEVRWSPGVDIDASLGTLAQRMGTRALRVSWSHLLADERSAVSTLRQLLNLARLWGILPVLDMAMTGGGKEEVDIRQESLRAALVQRVTGDGQEESYLPLCCLLPADDLQFPFPDLPRLTVSLTAHGPDARQAQLLVLLDEDPDWDTRRLVQQVALSWQDMQSAVVEAQAHSRLRGDSVTREADYRQAFLRRARKNFGQLAQRSTPQRCWEDIVISDELEDELRDLLQAIRMRETVLAQGFDRKLGSATGISALFHGNPGTGKTLVAEVLATELGVDLIKVDLSTVVNKYIGETEKNLGRIFDLAAQDAGVLFFDEADALFGKRSESKDAKDRHANIEVAYLLQRLEQHPGLVILATNHRGHLDDAFTRRFTFITRFLWPDAALRERMWRQAWPDAQPLAKDVDFTRLAQVQLTGANIRNIALQASWLAAGEPCVNAAHIDKALRREMAKMGRNL